MIPARVRKRALKKKMKKEKRQRVGGYPSGVEHVGEPCEGMNDAGEGAQGITDEELRIAISVLDRLSGDQAGRFKSRRFKGLRTSMGPLLAQMANTYQHKALKANARRKASSFGNVTIETVNPVAGSNSLSVSANLEAKEAQRRRELDAKWRDTTLLRAKRLEKLKLLERQDMSPNRLLLPSCSDNEKMAITSSETKEETADIRIVRVPDGVADAEAEEIEDARMKHEESPKHLHNAILCYICKRPFTELHYFYDKLCPECATLNFSKRHQKANLAGKVCLVTGARVKIGFRCALILLRAGATVIATSRFPHDAARRYAAQEDNDCWKDRLQIYGLDFRDSITLERFCEHLKATLPRLDAIINNACQTIRRPRAYYRHLLKIESQRPTHTAALFLTQTTKLEREIQGLSTVKGPSSTSKQEDILILGPESLGSDEVGRATSEPKTSEPSTSSEPMPSEHIASESKISKHKASVSRASVSKASEPTASGTKSSEPTASEPTASEPTASEPKASGTKSSGPKREGILRCRGGERRIGLSVAMSQMIAHPEDTKGVMKEMPVGKLDVNDQQVDLRRSNSWMLRLDEVSTPELSEVFAINAMAPFILNARLRTLMARDKDSMKFIVNVSAMEGKFYRYKSDRHPHTNMAKAALNMMTRTSAQDYLKDKIYMTAVDTGWINDEKPIESARRHMTDHNFQTPLDEVDAAARVLDPMMRPLIDLQAGKPLSDIKPHWGVFLKDYAKTEW